MRMSQKLSNLKVQTINITHAMSIHKITSFISELKDFFKNSDMTIAMQHISSTLSGIRMSEKITLGVESKQNCIYRLLTVFQWLIMFPYLGIKNTHRVKGSGFEELLCAQKDVFYRFMERPDIKWRKALWNISVQLWNRIHVRSDHKAQNVCLIIDDTDHNKTGRTFEMIGRVHSHLQHRVILGFKCLCMAVTDGFSQLLLDFDIVGEKGKNGNYGMSDKELSRRRTVKRTDNDDFKECKTAYKKKKTELSKEMITRATRHGIKFRYILADSWFTCKDLVNFIHTRRYKCHWMGMIKVGEKSTPKYHTSGGDFTAPELVRRLKKDKKYSKKLKCHYIVVDAMFADVAVRIFLVRRTNHGSWNGLLTTDTSLSFLEAWKIYSRRWSLEVVFKDCKGYLGFGKCQSTNFASQIAAATLCCIQYNILSVAKRFLSYETIGGIFREVSRETIQLSVAQQIWTVLQELVDAIAEAFGITDEEIYEVIFAESNEFAYMCHIFDKLKSAS